MLNISLPQIEIIAAQAHSEQQDKAGIAYIEHLRAVKNALVDFSEEVQAAGLLHDVLEDTNFSESELLAAGVPGRVVEIVKIVTRDKSDSLTYQEWVKSIASQDYEASLVKLADNAHNSDISRFNQDDANKAQSLQRRYKVARNSLLEVLSKEDAIKILSRINPALLAEN